MMHRRPGRRPERFPSGKPLVLFKPLVTSVPVLLVIQSDLGITLNGSTVSAWADQSGNGNHFSQGTAAKQPAYTQSGLNGFPVVTLDGVDDEMSSSGPDLPAPGTTNSFYWGVLRQDSWTASETLIQANLSGGMQLLQRTGGASPQLSAQNPTLGPANSGGAIGAFARFELRWSNSTSDYLKVGASSVTGTALGNNNPGAGMFLGRNFGGTIFSNFTLVAFMICGGNPSAAEKAALDAAVRAKYGSSVAV